MVVFGKQGERSLLFLIATRYQTIKQSGFFHSIIFNSLRLMKITDGKIRAWQTLKMTFSTYRESDLAEV